MAKEALQFLHPPSPFKKIICIDLNLIGSRMMWLFYLTRTIEIISARLGTKYPLKKGFQICINEREYPLGRVTF